MRADKTKDCEDFNNDFFDHTPLEITHSSMEPTPSKRVGRKSQRTKNFTAEEDMLLCKAWLEIGMDAGHDSEQMRKPYWSRIHEYFQQHKDFESDRSVKSLTTRWGVIHQAVRRFTECYSEIQHIKHSVKTELDKINDAKELYYSVCKGFFKFEYCWNVLKDEPKWIVHTTEKKRLKTCKDSSPGVSSQPTSTSINLEEDGSQTQTSAAAVIEGPLSRKAEKETPRRGKNKAAEEDLPSGKSLNNMARVNQQSHRDQDRTIQFEKNQEEREKEEWEKERDREDQIREEEIMKLDLRNMAPHQVKYWTKKQLDILQKHNLM